MAVASSLIAARSVDPLNLNSGAREPRLALRLVSCGVSSAVAFFGRLSLPWRT